MAPSAISPAPPPTPATSTHKLSLQISATAASPKTTFLASSLARTLTDAPRQVPLSQAAATTGASETTCTDHMITVPWCASTGWGVPQLRPYGPLALMPTASVLHYATTCFEGLKAYRGRDGRLRVFRPDCNARRMLTSAARISLPIFDPLELEKLMAELLAVDGKKWLPRHWEHSFLYIRPTMIGTAAQLGVAAPREALLYIIVGYLPRLDAPLNGMRLRTSPEDTIRAWKGGSGSAKVGANYGPTMVATGHARDDGYHQVLWLYGEEGWCTEAGASNMFVVLRRRDQDGGGVELLTAPLDDRLILDGVTRRSVLQLGRERLAGEGVVVSERNYRIAELIEARREGRLLEAFAAGTAYFICPISMIHHRGEDISIPIGGESRGGDVTETIKKWIGDIMYGGEDHEWAVVIDEK